MFVTDNTDENPNINPSDKPTLFCSDEKNYSDGYFDENGNYIHSPDSEILNDKSGHDNNELTEIKSQKRRIIKETDSDKTKIRTEEQKVQNADNDITSQHNDKLSESTEIPDNSESSGNPEKETDRFGNIPILKICLCTAALIIVLVTLIVCMQKCGGTTVIRSAFRYST